MSNKCLIKIVFLGGTKTDHMICLIETLNLTFEKTERQSLV